MGHNVDGQFKLVTYGSKALTPTQQRYATIELECLAFTVKWVAGKENHIADALSRAPLFAPADLDNMYIDTARTFLISAESTKKGEFTTILDSMDADYIMLRNDILSQTCESRYAGQLKAVFDHLSVDGELVYLNARRIVMPIKGVKPILKLPYVSHVGVNKTYDLPRSIYIHTPTLFLVQHWRVMQGEN